MSRCSHQARLESVFRKVEPLDFAASVHSLCGLLSYSSFSPVHLWYIQCTKYQMLSQALLRLVFIWTSRRLSPDWQPFRVIFASFRQHHFIGTDANVFFARVFPPIIRILMNIAIRPSNQIAKILNERPKNICCESKNKKPFFQGFLLNIFKDSTG